MQDIVKEFFDLKEMLTIGGLAFVTSVLSEKAVRKLKEWEEKRNKDKGIFIRPKDPVRPAAEDRAPQAKENAL